LVVLLKLVIINDIAADDDFHDINLHICLGELHI